MKNQIRAEPSLDIQLGEGDWTHDSNPRSQERSFINGPGKTRDNKRQLHMGFVFEASIWLVSTDIVPRKSSDIRYIRSIFQLNQHKHSSNIRPFYITCDIHISLGLISLQKSKPVSHLKHLSEFLFLPKFPISLAEWLERIMRNVLWLGNGGVQKN